LTEKLAAAGINLHGLSAAVIGPRVIMYISLDSAEDAAKQPSYPARGSPDHPKSTEYLDWVKIE
jgi:hypothetical protein